MAQAMFQSPEKKAAVEAILHPLIQKAMEQWIQKQSISLIFIEVPLLFESHMEAFFDSIWCVVTSKEVALILPKQKRKRACEHKWIQNRKKSAVILC